ncbi:sugar nucleotide-binding protein [Cycloclasticus pugetii]|uniref:sugar nucleotide-binding protein n=1 Tax=Cycloclasticus pugetii TaxID=34068 RepID=UPI000912567B|nr:sugar nucleotide-binding protein [Cycloclasticus pugetii]SHI70937.1 Nucleoside-diphosphate-sugar epimerase [Cycloclasticus pugetii]
MAKIMVMGCGDVGTGLAERLAATGHEVTGVRRTLQTQSSDIHFIQADLTNAEQVGALDFNVDGLVYILSPTGRDISAYKDVFKTGVEHVLSAAKQQNPTLPIFFISSTRVYAQQQGEWVSEQSATEPMDERGRLLLQAEDQFLAFNEHATVIRFSGIYGRSNYFINQLKRGIEIQKVPPYYTNRIHREDCIGVLEFLLTKQLNDEGLERIYLASDLDPAEKWNVASYITKKRGLASCSAKILDKTASHNKRIDSRQLAEAGYQFRYATYKQGYEALMNEER